MIKFKKVCFISIIVILTLNIAGCGVKLKAGIVKHNKKDAESSVQVVDYKDELDYVQSKIYTLEESLLTSEMSNEEILKAFESFLAEIEIESSNLYFATEEDGEMFLYPEASLPEGYDGRTRDWYIQAKENNLYVSKLYQDAMKSDNIVTYAKALYKDDRLLGVIGIDIVIK